MFRILLVATIVLAAIAMALSLAHALELPGKMRLGKDAYLAVQTIYYPGFTCGGAAEPLGILALLALLALGPHAGGRFWWTLIALGFLVASHATYWVVTHPVNNFWVKDIQMSGLGATFFSMFTDTAADAASTDWTKLRDIWEYSHVARAVFAMLSLISIALAATA
jgi:hypothetical protein